MYVATIVDMDDVDPVYTLGPYDNEEAAERDGEMMVDFLSDETLPGHVHPHEWCSFITVMQTYEEVITGFERDIEADKAEYLNQLANDNPTGYIVGQEPWDEEGNIK